MQPDHLFALPIFHNPIFKFRKQLQAEWNLHPQLATIDTLLTDEGEYRPVQNIKQIIKEVIPSIESRTLKKLVTHAQSIQKRIPTWFRRRLDMKKEWKAQEIVKLRTISTKISMAYTPTTHYTSYE
eukprot:699355-Pleurochrysis_carterae.AAC.3